MYWCLMSQPILPAASVRFVIAVMVGSSVFLFGLMLYVLTNNLSFGASSTALILFPLTFMAFAVATLIVASLLWRQSALAMRLATWIGIGYAAPGSLLTLWGVLDGYGLGMLMGAALLIVGLCISLPIHRRQPQ